jgi:hypothetical protein
MDINIEQLCSEAEDRQECLVKAGKFLKGCERVRGKIDYKDKNLECNEAVILSIKDKKVIIKPLNPYEHDDTVKKLLFDGATSEINQDEAKGYLREEYLPRLNENLAENAQLSEDEYIENNNEIIGEPTPETKLGNYVINNDYFDYNLNDASEAVLKDRYEKHKEALESYEPEYNKLKELKNEIENLGDDRKKIILTFDKAIHAQHVSGSIIDEDIEELKKEVDNEAIGSIKLLKEVTA